MGVQEKKSVKRHRRHNLKERFEILKTLGQGTYGKVKLAIEKATGTKVCFIVSGFLIMFVSIVYNIINGMTVQFFCSCGRLCLNVETMYRI